jgi:FMN phosphatase YigB (HAD superfamily)
LLGRYLSGQNLIHCSPEAFARARLAAESRARSNSSHIEVTLAEIYQELYIGLTDIRSTLEQLAEAECFVEAELLRAVPEGRMRVSKARANGDRIVFICDMYLPHRVVHDQLRKYGIAEAGETLYLSSEHRKWKRDGSLFEKVIKAEGVKARDIRYVGNDQNSDIRPARSKGVAAQHLTDANLNRYEEALDSHGWASEGLTSAMAGASRLARLNTPANSNREKAIRLFGASVVAPTLVSFSLWLLQHAQRHGIKRLYFLSRDGEILLQIARRLAPKLGIDCELQYLYASRKAWGIPSITTGCEDDMAWLVRADPGPNLRCLLSRLDLSPENIRPVLEEVKFAESRWNANFSQPESEIVRSPAFISKLRPYILENAEKRRSLLLEYLKQQNVLQDSNYAIVDIGWHATLQDCLSRVVKSEGREVGRGVYFGLLDYHERSQLGVKTAYFVDGKRKRGYTFSASELVFLLETMCVGSEGTVVGFATDEKDNTVKPVLKSDRNSGAADWGLDTLKSAVFSFVDNLLIDTRFISVTADARQAVLDVLKLFWRAPSRDEAQMIADFPFEGGMSGDVPVRTAAHSHSWKQVLSALGSGSIPVDRDALWSEGSLALTPPLRRGALKMGMGARRRLGGAKMSAISVLQKRWRG